MNIAVFASGRGTNFSAIIQAKKRGIIKARIALLVCDNPKAGVIVRAKRAGVKCILVKRENYICRKDFELKIIQHLKAEKTDLIVLAGFMRIVGPDIIREYKNRIINIHPAILPSFKGAHGIRDAFNYGVKVTGVTVHFVDEKIDHGPIILQQTVKIEEADTLDSLELKIHKAEHRAYPEAIKLFLEDKLKVKAGKVRIATR